MCLGKNWIIVNYKLGDLQNVIFNTIIYFLHIYNTFISQLSELIRVSFLYTTYNTLYFFKSEN